MKKQKPLHDAIRYSSVGLQMVIMIGLCAYGGTRLDRYFETEKAFWTAGLAILGCIAAVFYMVKAFGQISKK